jgi:UDP-N-acetylmuramate--alanine ligase
LFSRTRLLLDDFAAAFEDADKVFIYDIYPAREENRWDVSSEELVERLGSRAVYAGPLSRGAGAAADACEPGGCAVVMGAGDIDTLVPELLDRLGQEARR